MTRMVLGWALSPGWSGCRVASGASVLTALVFFLGAFAIFLAIARVIAQGGVGFTSSTMLPQPFTVYTMGTEAMGWKGLAAVSLSYSWAAEMRTTVMASAANALKLAHGNRANGRRLFWGLVIAVVVGMAGAAWITLNRPQNRKSPVSQQKHRIRQIC